MDYSALLSTFALLFLSEMGDKTQLMAMTLAHRYRLAPVMLGTFAAFLLLNLLAVLVGEGVARMLPRDLVLALAGALFLLFGYRSWVAAEEHEEGGAVAGARHVWLLSFSLIFLAELGDKSQLALVAMAAQSGALWAVFLGGTLALWGVSLLGMLAGQTLLRRLPARWVHRAAGVLFMVFGGIAIGSVVLGRFGG